MSNSVVPPVAIHRRRHATRGRLLLILSALAFSTAGFFTREAPVDLWAMVFWRNLFGSIALLPLILASKNGTSWRSLLSLGSWGWATIAASSFATICYLAAFAYTSVANVSIIYATTPVMTALIAWLWLGERPARRTLAAAVFALLGVTVTVAGSLGGGMFCGDALALMMASAISLMTVLARRHARLPALLTACVCSAAGALAVLPLGLASGAGFIVGSQSMAWLAGFGVVTMAIALPCYLSGAAQLPAAQAMLISALEMPLAPLWVWLIFGEVPRPVSVLGGSVVALAIIWDMKTDAGKIQRQVTEDQQHGMSL